MKTKLTILIVEDDFKQRKELKKNFLELVKKEGHRRHKLLEASTIDEAVTKMKKYPIDVLLLDYQLKDPQGSDLKEQFGIDIINKFFDNKPLSKYKNHYLFIALISSYDEENFYELRDKVVNDLKFGFKHCPKPAKNFRLKDTYDEIINYFTNCPLPYPLAKLLYNLDNPLDKKFNKMIKFIEMSIKYLTIILLADIAHRQIVNIPEKLEFAPQQNGKWLEVLKKLNTWSNKENKDFLVPEIKEIIAENSEQFLDQATIKEFLDFFEKYVNEMKYIDREKAMDFLGLLDTFLKMRNDETHRLIRNNDPLLETFANKMEPIFNQFKDLLHFLYRYPLLSIDSYNIDEKHRKLWRKHRRNDNNYEPRYKYYATPLMNYAIPEKIDFVLDSLIDKDEVYITNGWGEFLSLHPLICYELDTDKPTEEEILMYNKVDKGRRELIYQRFSADSNVTRPQYFEEFQNVLNLIEASRHEKKCDAVISYLQEELKTLPSSFTVEKFATVLPSEPEINPDICITNIEQKENRLLIDISDEFSETQLQEKYKIYQQEQVEEYWVIDTETKQLLIWLWSKEKGRHDKSKTYHKNYSRSIYHSKSKFIESNKIELVPKHIIELTFDP